MKRIVVCCDGTWNRPDELSDGVPAPTNVVKLASAIAPVDPAGIEQRVEYHDGVGTRRFERLRGGALGFGLSRNIRDCYRFVVETFAPGDELFLFGFSRGAYTARSLAGLIRNAGILTSENVGRIDEAYALYRSRRPGDHPRGADAERFRRAHAHPDAGEHLIRLIGVWDTVGALGIPGVPKAIARPFWGFHDTDLSSRVAVALQALALDERRRIFSPTVWTRPAPDPAQRLEQVWFAGVHKDVGGGYADPALAEIPLLWMADGARGCGLAFRDGYLRAAGAEDTDPALRADGRRVRPDPRGTLHDSYTGIYRLLPPSTRRTSAAGPASGCAVSSSAASRVGFERYALPADAGDLPVSEVPTVGW